MMAVIRVYDESGNVIETQEHKGDFKRVVMPSVWHSSKNVIRIAGYATRSGLKSFGSIVLGGRKRLELCNRQAEMTIITLPQG